MSLRDQAGNILSRTELLALTVDRTPPADPLLELTAPVYEAHTEPGASAHEGGRKLKFRDGQLVRRSTIDNLYATATFASIAPTSGAAAGGTAVTIKGTNLSGVEGVTFDGVAATNVKVVNDTTVTCTTPAGAAGPADLVVQDDAGNVTALAAFTYTA